MKLVVFFLLFFNFDSSKDISLELILENDVKTVVSLSSQTLLNTTYISLHDVCTLLNSNLIVSPDQATFRIGETQIQFFKANSFAAVFDTKGNKKDLYQFFETPLFYASKVLISPYELVRLFIDVFQVQGTYSSELNLIKISFAKTAPDQLPTMQLNQLIDYKVETKVNGILIDFNFSKNSPKFEYIKSNKESTSYLTIAQSSLTDERLFSKTFDKSHPIKSIQPILLPQNIIQFTIEFNAKEFKILSSSAALTKPNQIRIQVNFKSDIKTIYETEQRAFQTQRLVDERQKWNLDVITIDAGHGGKDSGANGSTGLLEKNVSLAISLKLAQILKEQCPEIKIVFTRDTDKFVPLDERGKIANEHQSKLFISLHCNASTNISAYGIEVYLLGLHKTEAALAIAERENSVINAEDDFKTRYETYTEENLITLTMAQNAFITQSHSLAELVHSEIISNTRQQPRGVRQAGFMVLWTPSMPSILIETGYITNKDEEKFLASEEGQNRIALSIANAVVKYKNKYESQ